jgi:hypothetical protein
LVVVGLPQNRNTWWAVVSTVMNLLINLGFVVPCIFKYSNKTPNQMQQSIVKFIAWSHRHCSTCFGHYYAHHQELFQTSVAASSFHMKAEVDFFQPWSVCYKHTDHGWKHIHLGIYTETRGCNCSLKELLMMGIIMPEAC